MKSARPVSAHAQKGSSPGSEEMFGRAEAGTSSASSRSRLIIFPMRGRRTPSLPKTCLYCRRISSLASQTNVSRSIQPRSSLALGFLGVISWDLSPAIPATRTDVSPEVRRPLRTGGELSVGRGNLMACGLAHRAQSCRCRALFAYSAAFPNGIPPLGVGRHASHLIRRIVPIYALLRHP
jgi:hypothetical protein